MGTRVFIPLLPSSIDIKDVAGSPCLGNSSAKYLSWHLHDCDSIDFGYCDGSMREPARAISPECLAQPFEHMHTLCLEEMRCLQLLVRVLCCICIVLVAVCACCHATRYLLVPGPRLDVGVLMPHAAALALRGGVHFNILSKAV